MKFPQYVCGEQSVACHNTVKLVYTPLSIILVLETMYMANFLDGVLHHYGSVYMYMYMYVHTSVQLSAE